MSRLILLGKLVALALVCLAFPATAAAATSIQSPGGTSIVYSADPGQANALTISRSGANYVFTDAPAVAITAIAPCVSVANTASCPAATVRSLEVSLNDLNDAATVADSVAGEVRAAIFGGAGNDNLVGGKNIENQLNGDDFAGAGTDTLTGGDRGDRLIDEGGNDVVTGGLGNDVIRIGDGADVINAGPGDDVFVSGADPDGPDELIGGPDSDRMDFRNRTASMTISFDDAANDGAGCPGPGCEGDNFRSDIEELTAGGGADTLIGNAGRNDLRGDDGDDTINGGGGNDELGGDQGDDVVNGGDGNDQVNGGNGADIANGGAGDDYLSTNFFDEADVYSGGPGIDELGGGGDSRDPLSIDLDGVADDGLVDGGTTAAKDNVLGDVEGFEGGGGDDILIGSAAPNEIEGGGGDDQIIGGGGGDALSGDDGNDTIDGGGGVDSLFGGGGSDSLRSRDSSSDQIDCGSSPDLLLADGKDDPEASCEKTSTGLLIGGSAKLAGKSIKLKLSCPAAEGIACKAKVKLKKGKKTVASGKGKIGSGKSKALKLKLKRGGLGGAKLKASASFKDAAGAKVTSSRKVRVR